MKKIPDVLKHDGGENGGAVEEPVETAGEQQPGGDQPQANGFYL